jgi:hypothetical protein
MDKKLWPFHPMAKAIGFPGPKYLKGFPVIIVSVVMTVSAITIIPQPTQRVKFWKNCPGVMEI